MTKNAGRRMKGDFASVARPITVPRVVATAMEAIDSRMLRMKPPLIGQPEPEPVRSSGRRTATRFQCCAPPASASIAIQIATASAMKSRTARFLFS
ncbi:hypothetical protein D3C87_1224610 [compost metagenome]